MGTSEHEKEGGVLDIGVLVGDGKIPDCRPRLLRTGVFFHHKD